MIETYKPSGKFTPIFPLYLIGAFAVIIGLAWLYVRVLDWIPLIYISFLATAAFGFGCAMLLHLAVNVGKCRNVLLATLAGLLIGAGAIGAKHWMQYKYTLGEIAKIAATENGGENVSADEVGQQITFPLYIDFRVKTGWSVGRRGSSGDISGIFVYGVWLLEALVVLACCVVLPRGKAKEPFSESSDKWADEETALLSYMVPEHLPVYEDVETLDDVLDFPEPADNSPRSLIYKLNSVPGEDEEDSYLSVISQHLSYDKEGKANTVDTNVFEFVPISAERRSELLACIAEFTGEV